jgi:murein L,D-transpeptidase YafK
LNGCLDGRVVARMHLACLLLAVALLSAFRTIRTAHRRLSGTGYAVLLQYTALLGIIFLVPGIAFAHAPGASVMGPAPFENPAKGRIPDPFLYLSPQNPGQVLLVEKASQKAYLYRNTDLVHAFRTYPCSTGERSGPKTARNDKRTPEGIYYVTNSFKEQELASIYGARAFPIDYPNPLDRELRRMGYGIWIHGTNEPLKPWDTNGCVVFRNEDILDLSRYIHEGQTPIIITQKINFVEEEMLQREGAELKRLVIEWLESWRESRVERYMSFYGQDFVSQGKDWHQWRAHKKRLTEKYGRIDIKIDGLQILRENGVVLARFIQTYRADGFFSNGVKRLYLMKKSPEWKITYEFFTKKTGVPAQVSAEVARKREVSSIERFINRWQEAWQEKDLEGYMAAYTEDFFSGGLDRDGWRRHKAELNAKYRRIRVEVRDLRIKLISSERAIVHFDQEYSSDRHDDYGRKTLQIVKRDERWRIKSETWAPLKGRKAR